MCPKRLTEGELQELLDHTKMRADPAFNQALQVKLRTRAMELRNATAAESRQRHALGGTRAGESPAYSNATGDQRSWLSRLGLGLGQLSAINVLSTAVSAIAILAFVFFVFLQPMLGGEASEPKPTEEIMETPIGETPTPADGTPTEESTRDVPATEPPVIVAATPTLTPTDTATPTGTATPTLAPTHTATLTPITTATMAFVPTNTTAPDKTPTPTITIIVPPSATPVPVIKVTCSWTQVSGYVEIAAPYVRVTVSLAGPPIQEIGTAVGPVQPDGSYSVTVTYTAQPTGTHLIGGYGEWDGASWLRPATTFGADCTDS